MRVNVKAPSVALRTHEGAQAVRETPLQQLRRSVLACLLWEDNFYEDGEQIAARIQRLAHEVKPQELADLAVEARSQMQLRHVSLMLARELARHPKRRHVEVGRTVADVIQRADELAEFVALYWKDGKQPLSAQVKKGLRSAFRKFNAYQLAKYNRDGAIKLRDVLFLCHAKPQDAAQEALWKQLVDGTLESPDTWEVNLSGGADKRETFKRLIAERKLGYMALLRNLRNMFSAYVNKTLVAEALMQGAARSRALPFRFIAAARAVPVWEDVIDAAMQESLKATDLRLSGRTTLLVDVSGSMDQSLSAKSDLRRLDAATGLAILLRGVCEDISIYTFSDTLAQVPPRTGMALADAIARSQPHGGTYLGAAVAGVPYTDRLIVITDEQSADRVPSPQAAHGYMLNVASHQNGVGSKDGWSHITGFSESVVRYIAAAER